MISKPIIKGSFTRHGRGNFPPAFQGVRGHGPCGGSPSVKTSPVDLAADARGKREGAKRKDKMKVES